MESLYPQIEISDIKADKKSAEKIEQYKVSAQAIYLPRNQYLPLGGVEKMQIRHGMMNTKGCCGLTFPVHNVVMFVKGSQPIKILCEKEKNAIALVEKVHTSHPGIILEEYIPPHKAET